MTTSAPLVMAILYVALMFAGAALAHRHRERLQRSRARIHAYTLALAVYCTSWTYFGTVGTAATGGLHYLPIYLGPILMMVLGGRFLRRMNAQVQSEGATSISDFIGSRFGKSRSVAALVTLIALFGTIPYIALQLRSVAVSFAMVSGTSESVTPLLGAAVALALFAIIFGVRRYEVAARNEAVLFAVAVESIIKLTALGGVALLALWLLWMTPSSPDHGFGLLRRHFSVSDIDADFLTASLLSVGAILCLPRQFYVTVMEAREPDDILRARWGFVAYLLLTVLAVPPITIAGLVMLGGDAPPDFFVLSLPGSIGAESISILVFLGGLSAALAMVVTEAIALSSMISNDLFAPILLRRRGNDAHLGEQLLWVRRAAIIALIAASVGFALMTPGGAQLASVGLIAFVAISQCAPVLIAAVRRTGNEAAAAKAGLSVGFLLWLVTLFVPAVAGAALPLMLRDPRLLLGMDGISPITFGATVSLSGNILSYWLVAWIMARRGRGSGGLATQHGIARISDMGALADLVVRFVGPEQSAELFGTDIDPSARIDLATARAAERLIGSVVGASSARAIMASAMSGRGLGLSEVAQMLDASGQSLHFSQGLLAATLENIDIGVSVIDRNLRLVAWNSRYLELFAYPAGLVRVGVPVADLIRFNAERGECGPGEVEGHVERRLAHMRVRRQHSFERERSDGRVLKTVGGPMPDGGYVMSFTDITLEAQAREATETARRDLERAVAERTAQLSDVNAKLARANADKTRFLAAASHDLLQPLHAAMLFSGALRRTLPEQGLPMLSRIDRSIEAANDLLRALLDISKLDAGGIVPQRTVFSVRSVLTDLIDGFQPLAAEKGLRLRIGGGDAMVETDRTLLRSILQNFLSNAIRYTSKGRVVIGARRRGGRVRIEVYDTGIGIPGDKLALIFREFERLGQGTESGIGLGLAIVERAAPLIGGAVDVRSTVGRGSRFALTLPVAQTGAVPGKARVAAAFSPVTGRRLLVVDDDAVNREGMKALLSASGHQVVVAADEATALAAPGPFDAAIIDYHLGGDGDGIDLIDALRARDPGLPTLLVTAERGSTMLARAAQRRVDVLPKPLEAQRLDQWLAEEVAAARAAE